MIRIDWHDDDAEQPGELSLTFRFWRTSPEELAQARVLVQTARNWVPCETMFEAEVVAVEAYLVAMRDALQSWRSQS